MLTRIQIACMTRKTKADYYRVPIECIPEKVNLSIKPRNAHKPKPVALNA